MLSNGADEVVYPDKEMAEHLAIRTTADNILDFFNLTDNISIYEIVVPKSWIGKSVIDLDVRKKFNVSIVATKTADRVSIPSAQHIFENEEHILVIGDKADVFKISGTK